MCYLRAICVSFGCVLSPPYPLADSTRLSARCARPDGSQIASRYLRPPPPSPQHPGTGATFLLPLPLGLAATPRRSGARLDVLFGNIPFPLAAMLVPSAWPRSPKAKWLPRRYP
jgi:hypothetical protein